MNGNEMLDIVGKIDQKLVKQAQKPPVIRWIALAACLALVIGITAMLLRPGALPAPSNPVLQAPTEPSPTVPSVPTSPITPSTLPTVPSVPTSPITPSTLPSDPTMPSTVPSDPTVPSTLPSDPTVPNNPPAIQLSPIPLRDFTIDPQKITGVQHLGSLSFPGNALETPVEPKFDYHLIVECKVTSVLPYTYQDPLDNQEYCVLKLETLDVINGNNIPDDFYLRLPSYFSTRLQSFDSLIISMHQVGIEDYILINSTKRVIESFSLLFECEIFTYCFSIVPFTDGMLDPTFFEDNAYILDYFSEKILSGECLDNNQYPAKAGYTPADTKAQINSWIANRPNPLQYRNLTVYTRDSFAYDEVFDYIETGVFAHARPNKPIYCRIINGFPTTEQITITVDSVTYSGEAFTQQDLQAMPDIGAFMEGLDLDTLAPPHIKDTSNLELIACGARGMYAKVDGRVYGLVKINWAYFDKDAYYDWAFYDGLYYLATTDGTIRPIEREELLALLGDNPGVQFSSYGYQAFIDSFEYGIPDSTEPADPTTPTTSSPESTLPPPTVPSTSPPTYNELYYEIFREYYTTRPYGQPDDVQPVVDELLRKYNLYQLTSVFCDYEPVYDDMSEYLSDRQKEDYDHFQYRITCCQSAEEIHAHTARFLDPSLIDRTPDKRLFRDGEGKLHLMVTPTGDSGYHAFYVMNCSDTQMIVFAEEGYDEYEESAIILLELQNDTWLIRSILPFDNHDNVESYRYLFEEIPADVDPQAYGMLLSDALFVNPDSFLKQLYTQNRETVLSIADLMYHTAIDPLLYQRLLDVLDDRTDLTAEQRSALAMLQSIS